MVEFLQSSLSIITVVGHFFLKILCHTNLCKYGCIDWIPWCDRNQTILIMFTYIHVWSWCWEPVFNTFTNIFSGSMEPAFYRGDLLFLTNYREEPIRAGEIVVFKIEGREIPIVHRVLKVHEKYEIMFVNSWKSLSFVCCCLLFCILKTSLFVLMVNALNQRNVCIIQYSEHNIFFSSKFPNSFIHLQFRFIKAMLYYSVYRENGTVKFLTKGDNNSVDDRGLYAPGQLWLEKKEVVGRARG